MPPRRPVPSFHLLRCLALAASCAGMVPFAGAQDQRLSREQMWRAPTEKEWKKPVLIQWQRSWEDALAVSKETGKPILICVNMDGEIASEHYAGVRYREPEKAKLYEPYVCVIVSVYRHTPRDFDEHGQRIPCPRFGQVTCGEHIAIEPILYEKFMDGRRIAPRHIMVELDGKEAFDVYYAFDTDSVFKAIEDGITTRKLQPRTIVRGDRTIVERVASRDSKDRTAVEAAYQKGDRALRTRLLEAALSHSDTAPDDLLRLAVYGFDTELARLARRALANSDSAGAVDVINEALRVPMNAQEREALVAALARLGKASPWARTLAVVHSGLGRRSSAVDVEGWSKDLAGAEYPAPPGWSALESRLAERDKVSRKRPKDAAAQLELAEATLALARDPKTQRTSIAGRGTSRNYARLMFEDAHTAALEAEKLGAEGWRLDSALAITAKQLGDTKEAYARAEAAVKKMPSGVTSWNGMATLELFAEARQQAIIDAVLADKDWNPQWLTDVHSTYAVLARHPLGNDLQVVAHYDFLDWLRAKGQASRCLEKGLRRFPDSWLLHDRLRGRILQDKGVAGLEPAYEAMLQRDGASPNLEWFAGYTSIVAAEFYRRRGSHEKSLAAYGRAIAHYEKCIATNPESRPSADHYIALAMAGRARIAYEGGDYERALEQIVAAFEHKPSAAATLDGLNISAVQTAKMLRAFLLDLKEKDLAAKLDDALGKLDPAMLEVPAYERQGPGTRRRGR